MKLDELKVLLHCETGFVWYEEEKDGKISWHSQGSFLMRELQNANKLPPFQIIHDMSNGTEVHRAIHTIHEGRAALDPDLFGMNWFRYQFVDFAYSSLISGVHIMSTKRTKVGGRIIDGVFDELSYRLIIASIALLTIVMLLFEWKRIMKFGWIDGLSRSFIYAFGPFVKEPVWIPGMNKLFSGFVLIIGLFLSEMYCSVVISMILSKGLVEKIDSLQDLATKYTDKQIYIVQQSFEDDAVKISPLYKDLLPRIVYHSDVEPTDFWDKMYSDVLAGTHVSIALDLNFEGRYSQVSREIQCKIPLDSFRKSDQTLILLGISMIHQKNFSLGEYFTRTHAWLAAYGLTERLHDNGGLISDSRPDWECPKPEPSDQTCPLLSESPETPLSWHHVKKLFYFFFISLAFATLIFIIELLISLCL